MAAVTVNEECAVAERSFDSAFEPLSLIAYRVARRILGGGGDAENVAAETLARAQLHWQRIHDHADAWVVTVATRLAVREAKRTQRRFPFYLVGIDRDESDRAAGRVDLAGALAKLSRRQRHAIALRYLADLTDAQAAKTMDCSVPSFRTHCNRALRALRDQLGDLPRWLPQPSEPD